MTGLGLALGGGGARGLAHIGVLKVLAQEGIKPDVLAGTSMGGLVGAFTAAGYTPEEMMRAASSVSWRALLDLRPGSGLLRVSGFESFLERHLPPTFEGLHTPLIVTATDVLTGRLVYLHRGDLYAALRATCAYPGAVDPVPHDGMLLADGGILNQVPVDGALFLGARRVVAVDVTAPAPLGMHARKRFVLWQREVGLGPLKSLMRALEVMQAQLTDARLSLYQPDVLLRPKFDRIDLTSFHRTVEAAHAGELAALEALDRIRHVAAGGASQASAAMLPREEGDE